VIERASKLDTVRVLTEIAVASPYRVRFMRCLKRGRAETKILIPAVTRFRDRHQAHDIVVVADAGMLSAANLLALEDGFPFIVGSRTGKIPYELEAHVERYGNYLAGGAPIEATRRMGTGRRRWTGEWSTTTRSNVPSTTTRRSTP
jgi:hypothetical protein